MVAKIARFLAPLALVAVAFGVYTIVHSNLAHKGATASISQSSTSSSIVDAGRRGGRRAHHMAQFYVVRSGDTLSGIAARTGIGLDTLIQLNPKLAQADNNLQIGERLRLRPRP